MAKRILLILLLPVLVSGCMRSVLISRILPRSRAIIPKNATQPASPEKHAAEPTDSRPPFTVGEKLTYLMAWKRIPVGTATVTVEALTTFKGYDVYKIVVTAKTNVFLSKLFKVEDTFTSYMDRDKLISRRYEATIREGRYKKDLVVDYDFAKHLATYRNLTDGSVKTTPVEKNVHDPISAAYFFRTMSLKTGDKIKITVNLCERNYVIFADVEKMVTADLPESGTFEAFMIKPYIELEGKRQKRAMARGYISAGKRRLVLYAVIKVLEIPWIGNVTATLREISYGDRTD